MHSLMSDQYVIQNRMISHNGRLVWSHQHDWTQADRSKVFHRYSWDLSLLQLGPRGTSSFYRKGSSLHLFFGDFPCKLFVHSAYHSRLETIKEIWDIRRIRKLKQVREILHCYLSLWCLCTMSSTHIIDQLVHTIIVPSCLDRRMEKISVPISKPIRFVPTFLFLEAAFIFVGLN